MSDEFRPKQIPPVPKTGAQNNPDELKVLINDRIYYTHPLRASDFARHRKSELYDEGIQWLKKGAASYDEGSAICQWVPMSFDPADPNYIPMPVFNEGHGARANESARLARPNYRPKVKPKSHKPDLPSRIGATRTQQALRFRLKDMEWEGKEWPLACYRWPLHGGFWWKSEWVATWDKTTMVPVSTAVKCADESCGLTLSTPEVPRSMVGGGAENAFEPTQKPDVLKAKACPRCDTNPPMLPFKPSMEEARGSKDALGRPLGKEVPLGDWYMSVRNPDDMFPRNMGFDMAPGHIDEWVEVHVESLDWLCMRWPDAAKNVKPENPATLAKYHPVAGAPDILGGGVLRAKTFRDSVRVKELHKKPFMEYVQNQDGTAAYKLNRGRSIIQANGVTLLDDHYMLESLNFPGEYVERTVVDYIPWEFRDGGRRLEGLGLWDLMADAQDSRNMTKSQTQAVNRRMAVPIYLTLKQQDMEIKAMASGVPGYQATIEHFPEMPADFPRVLNNVEYAQGLDKEGEDASRSIDKLSGNIEVEKGQVPTGVAAALAIEKLKEASGEKREPKLNRGKLSLARGWSHGARLMEALYIEPRPIRYEDEDGEERTLTMDGKAMARQTDVDVEAEADFDEGLQKSQVVRDMVGLKILDPNTLTPRQKRVCAELLHAPDELYADEDLQSDAAEREWIEFRDEGENPVLDPSMDDHGAHFEQHGRAWHSEWMRDVRDRAGWDEALKILGDIPLEMIAQLPGPPCMQDRIVQFWTETLTKYAFNPPDADALGQCLAWRAHTEAHKLSEQLKQMRAMAGPEVAAPGAQQTAAGTQPTQGSPPQAPVAA